MFEWNAYLIAIAIVGALFFASAVAALVWAVRSGQFRNLDAGANVIFDEEEPEGVHQDFFPGEAEKQRRKLNTETNPQNS